MTNANLKDALANAEASKDEAVEKDETLGQDDLSEISGGLMDAAGDCKAMACGVF